MNLRTNLWRTMLMVAGLSLAPLLRGADDKKPPPPKSDDDEVIYTASASQAPGERKGGISRGCNEDPTLYASILAPRSRAGGTAKAQPVLFWYLSKPTHREIQIAVNEVIDANSSRTLYDLHLKKGVDQAGIQRLDLSSQADSTGRKVELKPGVAYECVVGIIVRNIGRSINPNAKASIQRIPLTPGEQEELEKTAPGGRAAYLARHGLWFDMLAALDARGKESATARDAWRRVLKDEGLNEDEHGKIEEAAAEPSK